METDSSPVSPTDENAAQPILWLDFGNPGLES